MRLTLANHPVSDIRFGDATRLDGTVLTINRDALRRHLLDDARLADVTLEIVRPGEQSRIGNIFDILEPRAKARGDGSDFPGVLGPIRPAGQGTTHVLRGAAVTILDTAPPDPSRPSGGGGGGAGAGGKIVEMSGPAAAECPYATLTHVVIVPRVETDLERHTALNAIRLASVKTAVYLAQTARDQQPESTETFELEGPSVPGREGLPRFAYIGQIQGRQMSAQIDEQVLYGTNTLGMVPVMLHPNEWMDGALLVAYWTMNVETYFWQNHPVIQELYRWHREGKINFVGSIATMAGNYNEDRELNAMMCAQLARWNLAADAAVLTKYGGGAPHADMGMTAHYCEELGIRTVVQVQGNAQDNQLESAMLFNYPDVDAIVAMGGNNFRWPAAQVEHIIAANPAAATALRELKELTGQTVCGFAGQQGNSRARTFVY